MIELDIEGTKKLKLIAKSFGFRNKLEFIEAIADGRLEVVASSQTEEAHDHAITELGNAIATLRSFQDDIRNLAMEFG